MITLKETLNFISKMAAVITPIVIIGGAYTFYMGNIYQPSVSVNSVDWSQGTAQIKAASKNTTLYRGQNLMAGTNRWSVAFSADGKRIELLQRNLVYKVLAQAT